MWVIHVISIIYFEFIAVSELIAFLSFLVMRWTLLFFDIFFRINHFLSFPFLIDALINHNFSNILCFLIFKNLPIEKLYWMVIEFIPNFLLHFLSTFLSTIKLFLQKEWLYTLIEFSYADFWVIQQVAFISNTFDNSFRLESFIPPSSKAITVVNVILFCLWVIEWALIEILKFHLTCINRGAFLKLLGAFG